MTIDVEAVYQHGSLKLDQPLPFKENERLMIRILPKTSRAQESYGRFGWSGDPDELRKIAEDDEVLES